MEEFRGMPYEQIRTVTNKINDNSRRMIMSFKIGFTAETEKEEKRIIENTPVRKEAPVIKKSK